MSDLSNNIIATVARYLYYFDHPDEHPLDSKGQKDRIIKAFQDEPRFHNKTCALSQAILGVIEQHKSDQDWQRIECIKNFLLAHNNAIDSKPIEPLL